MNLLMWLRQMLYDVMTMVKANVVNGMPVGPESDAFCFMPFDSVGINL